MRYRHEPGVSCVNDDGALRPRTFDNSRGEVESHESSLALRLIKGQSRRAALVEGARLGEWTRRCSPVESRTRGR
jgi:hypothetical protein